MDKKFLLLFPPSWYLLGPHLALPLLKSQLKKAGFNASVRDLNIEFFNDIFSKEYFEEALKKLNEEFLKGENSMRAEKYENLSYLINQYGSKFDVLSFYIQNSLNVVRSKKHFYNINLLRRAAITLSVALEIITAPYFPFNISFHGKIEAPNIDFNYQELKEKIFDKSYNLFLDYYKDKVEEIKAQNLDFIGISISSTNSFVSGLTLAYMLKKETNAHICIGGQMFSRITDTIIKTPELFDLFADSFMSGESEKTIVQMAKYINNEIPIESVENLIYKKDNQIIVNPSCKQSLNLNEIEPADFSDLDFSKYFSPEALVPITMNKGCYWGKCTFCDIPHRKTFSVKDINALIDEILNYKQLYNTRFFYVIDEAVLPQYLDKLCDELINRNIEAYFIILARFENEFSYKLLKKMKKAGILYVQWGYEAASERILKLMNKGINPKKRIPILKNSTKAGIMNHIYSIWDFPSETFKEAKKTIKELSRFFADVIVYDSFILTKHSSLSAQKQGFCFEGSEEQYDFLSFYNVKNNSMTDSEREEIKELEKKLLPKAGILFDYNLYYLAKYGLKYMKKLKKSEYGF